MGGLFRLCTSLNGQNKVLNVHHWSERSNNPRRVSPTKIKLFCLQPSVREYETLLCSEPLRSHRKPPMFTSSCLQPNSVTESPSLKPVCVCFLYLHLWAAAPAGGPGAGAGEGELADPHGGGGGREQRGQRHRRLGEQTSGKDTHCHLHKHTLTR